MKSTGTTTRRILAIIPGVILLAVPALMLYPLWADPLSAGEDDLVYYYPLRKMVGQQLQQGRWPVHNPLEATGMPLMADPQSAVMYPPTWLFATMDAKLAYSLSIFLAFSLAGGGTYLYLRRIGLFRTPALFGATAFMFCGFMVGHRVHLAMIHTAAFLPWGLWCIEGLRQRRKAVVGTLAWMTAVAFLAVASGHWPTLIHVGIVWLAYLLIRGRPLLRSVAFAALALAIAACIAAPQIQATSQLLAQTTRNRISYAMAGENSFFPAAGVLALFPFLMGSRTPNFFPQSWWGAWHLCEMLGYVGLATLTLAGASVWRLYRKSNPGRPNEAEGLVRTWTWIAVAAGVWMLGYYLPSYWLIHQLPVLGVVRCPARMVLAVDLALASLAAVAVHAVMTAEAQPSAAIRRTVRRAATFVLPAAMLAVLGAGAIVARVLSARFPAQVPYVSGTAGDVLRAVRLANPAVWVPLALVGVSAATILWWLGSPRRRGVVLVGVLLVDLFFVTRFVDVPARSQRGVDPEASPAAKWLGRNAKADPAFRVWGLSGAYHHRPAELLLPKTCESLGVATIGNYGPFQSPAHAHLLGFRIFGSNPDWARLIRRNYLLSLYGVRYIVAAEREFRDVIGSVRMPSQPAGPDGPNLLGDRWQGEHMTCDGAVLRLEAPMFGGMAVARHDVSVRPGTIHRISLDARAPTAAADSFRAEIVHPLAGGGWQQLEGEGMRVFGPQLDGRWRHFERTLQISQADPAEARAAAIFQIYTWSDCPIEVRNVQLRRSDWETPVGLAGRPSAVPPGQVVYRQVAELKALRPGDPPVAIYENLLYQPPRTTRAQPAPTADEIESLKWRPELTLASPGASLPRLDVTAGGNPTRLFVLLTLPSLGLWVLLVIWSLTLGRRAAGRS